MRGGPAHVPVCRVPEPAPRPRRAEPGNAGAGGGWARRLRSVGRDGAPPPRRPARGRLPAPDRLARRAVARARDRGTAAIACDSAPGRVGRRILGRVARRPCVAEHTVALSVKRSIAAALVGCAVVAVGLLPPEV